MMQRSFAFLLLKRFYKLSCDKRPGGRLLAFAGDNVSIPIHPITAWPSLFPPSYSRTAIGQSYNWLSQTGAIRGSHVPLAEVCWVRCLLSAGKYLGHESAYANRFPHRRYLLVQAYKPLPLVTPDGLYHRFTYVHHTNYLALLRPMAARRICLSRFISCTLRASLHCQVRSLFRTLDSPGDTGGSLLFVGEQLPQATSCRNA